MKLKTLKKSTQYLIISIVGIVLNLIGIIILIIAVKEGDNSQIMIKSVLLFFWILFTVSNFFLYIKEKQREKIF
jgi:uncharacterized Tic20 family protein